MTEILIDMKYSLVERSNKDMKIKYLCLQRVTGLI